LEIQTDDGSRAARPRVLFIIPRPIINSL
jgi:hypothetical protein